MNKCCIVGRLTKDVEIKLTTNQVKFCTFTLAVDRRFKDANGQRQADFISCIAWKQTAEFIQKYFGKGSRIGICGSIQTRSYETDDGKKVFITEVVADEAEFVESQSKPQETEQAGAPQATVQQAQEEPEGIQGELPFEI